MNAPRYMPYAYPRTSRKPGTQPLDADLWIETGPDHAVQMAERDRILAEVPTAAMATAGSEGAVAELGATLRQALTNRAGYAMEDDGAIRRPDGVTVPLSGGRSIGGDPQGGGLLVCMGRLVQEDFCILEKLSFDGEYVLTAAILCFPSRWRLEDKIGKPLTGIHAGVPDYRDDVIVRVNRIFDGIAPERPLWRANWSIHDRTTLRQTESPLDPPPPGDLYIRVERQTFRRLPESRAVIFGIRTHIDPLEAVPPHAALILKGMLETHSDEEISYRGGRAVHDHALHCLGRRCS